MRVGVYARISSESLRTRGQKTGRQIEECKLVAEERGWDVVATYADDNVSAHTNKPRPGFDRMLADIKAGRIDALLVYHVDRISRDDLADAYIRFRRLLNSEEIGCPVMDVYGEEYRLWTADGRKKFADAINSAQHQSDRASERIKMAFKKKRRDGTNVTGKYPYGYVKVSKDEIILDDERAQVVREIFDRFLIGERISSIARDLRRRGLPAPVSEAGWRARDVSTVLTRPRYAGLYGSKKPGGTTWREFGRSLERKGLKGGWPTVLTVDELLSAWALLDENAALIGTRASATGGPWRAATFMSGIAVCGSCGEPVAAQSSTNPRMMYTCGHKARVRHVQRRIGEVDAFVEERLVARVCDREVLELIQAAHNERQDDERAAWRRELTSMRRMRDENVDDWLAERISREAYTRVTEHVESRITVLENRLDQPLTVAEGDGALQLLGSAPDPATAWEGLNLDQRRIVAQAFIDSVWLFADRPHERGVTLSEDNVELVWRGEAAPQARFYPQVQSRSRRPTTEEALLADRRAHDVTREEMIQHALS